MNHALGYWYMLVNWFAAAAIMLISYFVETVKKENLIFSTKTGSI